MMKLVAVSAIALAASPAATVVGFSPSAGSCRSTATSSSTTSLNLFGSKPKDGSAGGGGGMMDQLAMFKKAQELSSKKAALDKELAAEPITGVAGPDDAIKATCKYIPPKLPASPTPGFETSAIDIDEAYLADVSCEELGEMLVEAIRDAEKKASEAVAIKYKALEEDMKEIMGGAAAAVGAGAEAPGLAEGSE